VVETSTHILGYMTTRMVWFPVGKHGFGQEVKDRKTQSHLDKLLKLGTPDEKHERVLYIDDLVMSENRKVLASMSPIFEDLIAWTKKMGIEKVVVNENGFSAPFVKRISSAGFEVVQQGISERSSFNSRKLPFPYGVTIEKVENRIDGVESEPEEQTDMKDVEQS
jgi:hypothetical protein